MRPKAQKEAFVELCLVGDYYELLKTRFTNDLLTTGKISPESKALLRQVDKRAERIYK